LTQIFYKSKATASRGKKRENYKKNDALPFEFEKKKEKDLSERSEKEQYPCRG